MMSLNHDSLVSMENNPIDVQGMYYSNQRMLFIGEGDFSFSSSHATQFGVANNIVATSLDSIEVLIKNYGMAAIENIKNLTNRGAQVIHCVNACNMAAKDGSLPLFASERSFYDVVNYNFPHAGFFGSETNPTVIRKHMELMQEFFKNAALMLAPGGVVYVAHRCTPPYDNWNLQENASMHGLEFMGSVPFEKSNFPGYKNRRGSGKKARDTFKLGIAAIFIFVLRFSWFEGCFRCRVWIYHIGNHPLKTLNIEDFLLQTLRSFKEGRSASPKTPVLQAIAIEVARLETLKLGQKKQRRLNSLKLVLKVMPLLIKTPAFAIHQIQGLQASNLYEKTIQCWSTIQKLALEAMEDEQNFVPKKLGQAERPKLFAEHDIRDSMKDGCSNEQQCEEVLEIYITGDIAKGALGDENEDSFCAFEVDTQLPGSMDEPENIDSIDHGVDDIMSTICQGEVYFHLGEQRSHEILDDMPDLEAFGVSGLSSGDIEDTKGEGDCLVTMIKYLLCCFGMSKS